MNNNTKARVRLWRKSVRAETGKPPQRQAQKCKHRDQMQGKKW